VQAEDVGKEFGCAVFVAGADHDVVQDDAPERVFPSRRRW
jgi:hypothetical protein